MDIFTLYVGQGDLAVVRSGGESIIVDSHMPDGDDVNQEQIEMSLDSFLSNSKVIGLILTGLDNDHACPAGVESILVRYEPDWVMYPTYYKDTDAASAVFATIDRERSRRQRTASPLRKISVRVDSVESRFLTGLSDCFSFELFSPHFEDMDSSNNSSIVLRLEGLDSTGFSYLVTGDTESDRWDSINRIFGNSLHSEVMSAPHHGALTGVNAQTILHVEPNTVLISAGVGNSYGHPDPQAVAAYSAVAKHVFTTNAEDEGVCLFTRRQANDFDTQLVRHFNKCDARA